MADWNIDYGLSIEEQRRIEALGLAIKHHAARSNNIAPWLSVDETVATAKNFESYIKHGFVAEEAAK